MNSTTIWHRMISVYQFSNSSFSFKTTRDTSNLFQYWKSSKKKQDTDPEHCFRWDPAFPKTKIHMCSFVPQWAGQNHRISRGQRCCFGRNFTTSLGFPRLVKQKIYWRCLDSSDTLLRDFMHLRVTRYISVCGMSRFSKISRWICCQDHFWNISSSTFLWCFLRRCRSWYSFQLGNLARALFPASMSSPCWWVSILEQSFYDMCWFYLGDKLLRSKEFARHAEFPSNFGIAKLNSLFVVSKYVLAQVNLHTIHDLQTSRSYSPLSGRLPCYLDPQDPQDPHPWDLWDLWCLPCLPGIPVFLCRLAMFQQLKNSRMKFPKVKPCGSMWRCYGGLWRSFCCNGHGWRVGLTWWLMVWSLLKSLISNFWPQQWWSSLASSWPMSLASSISFCKDFTWMPAWLP